MNVLITGSNSGFGRLTAETLARAGHTVYATMRGVNGKNAAGAAELRGLGPNVRVVELDVTDDASVDKAVSTIAAETGGAIDVVVNNAGRFSMGLQEAFTVDEVKSLFETNVFGPLRVNRAVLPHMRRRRSGLIVNISSIVGRISMPTAGTYSATKFALEALADTLRDEVRALGIDVALVEPGAFPTNVGNNGQYADGSALAADYGDMASVPQKMGEGLAQLFSSPMSPKPQDVADAVAALVAAPAGQRPDRVVVDNLSGAPVKALNAAYAEQRKAMLAAFGLA
ncbi:MAG: SDR family oxidoreductase [Betaproteobacteria bacterium]|jgi:NAD(P)-dependent dehydrogenase (short-subunit alcohol dehydrogenase family)